MKQARIAVFSAKVHKGRGKGPECSGIVFVETKEVFQGCWSMLGRMLKPGVHKDRFLLPLAQDR